MTIIRFLIVSLLSFLYTFTAAQDQDLDLASATTVDWGEELQQPRNTLLSKIITHNESGMYALRLKNAGDPEKEKVFLERYDIGMKLKRAEELDLRYRKKNRAFEDVIYMNGQLYLLTSFHNKAKKKNYLFKQKISSRLGISDRDIEMIGELDTRSVIKEGGFDFVQSRDTSKLMVYHALPYRKSEPENFKLRVFDQDFSELWSKDIRLPYNDEIFTVEEYRIDNDGNVYLLGVLYFDKARASRNGQPNYQYVILTYRNNGTEEQEHKIQLRDKFITDLTFRNDRKGNLICSGFYSEQSAVGAKGTYFLKMDLETGEIYNESLKEFDFELLTQDYSEGKRRRAEEAERTGNERRQAELYRFALDELILRSDGGALLIGEQYYVFEDFYQDFRFGGVGFGGPTPMTRVDYYYHYNDIIIVNIRPDGEIEWSTRIPKVQVTRNDGGYYSSYAMSIVRDKIYFIFNDDARNFNRNNNRQLFNFTGNNMTLSLVEVNKEGDWKIAPLYLNREVNLLTRPKICKQIGRKEMLLYGESGRYFRFANLVFE
ncbi:MAG: hypothetical protein AAF849_07820 [Bacteroidota bacterium]